jgi:aspartate-semialdehyde dehydrogenase
VNKPIRVAIVGITGLVGERIVAHLQQSAIKVKSIQGVASGRSLGRTFTFLGKLYPVQLLQDLNFSQVDLIFFAAGTEVSQKYVPEAIQHGCKVVDTSAAFREDRDAPFCVAGVNDEVISLSTEDLVVGPNCCVIPLVKALHVLQYEDLERVDVATYQSVSGAGRQALQQLQQQTNQGLEEPYHYNVIAQLGPIAAHGYYDEEWKIIHETRKLLPHASYMIHPQAVRVPTMFGHGLAVTITAKEPWDVQKVYADFAAAEDFEVFREGVPTPNNFKSREKIALGRLRLSLFSDRILQFWLLSDNISVGSALNAVRIAERLHARKLVEIPEF